MESYRLRLWARVTHWTAIYYFLFNTLENVPEYIFRFIKYHIEILEGKIVGWFDHIGCFPLANYTLQAQEKTKSQTQAAKKKLSIGIVRFICIWFETIFCNCSEMCQIMETPYGLSPPPPLLFSFPLKLVQPCLTLLHSSFLPLEKSEIEACKIYVSKMKIAKPASPFKNIQLFIKIQQAVQVHVFYSIFRHQFAGHFFIKSAGEEEGRTKKDLMKLWIIC